MFEKTLLESSPEHVHVLTRSHRIVTMLAGLAGFLATLKLLPMLFFVPSAKTLMVQAQIAGGLLALHALAGCYVYSEARRLRVAAGGWLALTLATSFIGFIAFLVYSARKTGAWKRATVPLASLFETLLVGSLVLVPLIKTEAISLNDLRSTMLVMPIPPPPPAAQATVSRGPRRPPVHVTDDGKIIAPPVVPDRIGTVVEEPVSGDASEFTVPGGTGIPGGTQDGVIRSILGEIARTNPPPPTPAQTKPKQPARMRVGGQVEAAKLIYAPKPEYPPLARLARIQGTVRLEAVISTDGRIQNLQVLSGHPLLLKAALDAVAQWRYQPTLLNGDPVEVITDVDVTFTLGE